MPTCIELLQWWHVGNVIAWTHMVPSILSRTFWFLLSISYLSDNFWKKRKWDKWVHPARKSGFSKVQRFERRDYMGRANENSFHTDESSRKWKTRFIWLDSSLINYCNEGLYNLPSVLQLHVSCHVKEEDGYECSGYMNLRNMRGHKRLSRISFHCRSLIQL